LLYLPEGETQELILLFMNYLLKARKFRVIYLGSQINANDVAQAVEACRPDIVFSVLNENMQRQSVRQYIENICQKSPNAHFWFTGYQLFMHNIESNKQLTVIGNLGEVIDKLENILSMK
jgi:hypothetical protein